MKEGRKKGGRKDGKAVSGVSEVSGCLIVFASSCQYLLVYVGIRQYLLAFINTC